MFGGERLEATTSRANRTTTSGTWSVPVSATAPTSARFVNKPSRRSETRSERANTITATSARFAAEDVADELADVVEGHPALAYGGDDRREIVGMQDHAAGVLGDVGAGDGIHPEAVAVGGRSAG